MRDYYTYDLECYPNIFTFCGKFKSSNEIQLFEISDRKNEVQELIKWLSYLRNVKAEMVGFNNIGYDYRLLHELMSNPYTFDHTKAFQVSSSIINSSRTGVSLAYIKKSDRFIDQIDLMKIMHFDNKARRTSLKALQFAMRSESLEDLPFDIRPLNDEEKDELCKYNVHDVTETERFLLKNEHLIEMRREYLEEGVLFGDVLNFSDVKIGSEMLINRLGRNTCFSGSKPKQTFRESVTFSNIILPKIYFRTEPYQDVHKWFKEQKVFTQYGTKPKLEKRLAGLDFHFGLGGVHASAENKIFHTDNDYQIIDIDVAGMYVAVAIANRFAPAHLGEAFVAAYRQIKEDRARHAKGTSKNAALKLAGNGAYGKSNDPYSPFYDPQYTYSVTINGQLQILQLAEILDLIPDLEIIQVNTDGITIRIIKKNIPLFKMWCSIWEEMTGLVLEHVDYNRMWIRDVNNYIAETMEGKLKRKGAYWYPITDKDYEGWWNKDFSNHASIIAAEKAMTHSWPIETAIKLVTNPFDFMLRYKATGQSKIYIGDKKQLRTVRYYVSTKGEPMKKAAPPAGEIGQYKRKVKLKDEYFDRIMKEIGKDVWDERIHSKNKSKYETRITSIESGWKVKQCNVASDFDWSDVDWSYYIEKAKKLIIGSK